MSCLRVGDNSLARQIPVHASSAQSDSSMLQLSSVELKYSIFLSVSMLIMYQQYFAPPYVYF